MSTPPAAGATANKPAKGARGKPRNVQKFPADEFQVLRPQTAEERAEFKRKREERSEQQKLVDKLVWGAYEDYVEAGKPTAFVDMPLVVWPVSLNLEEDARHMLGKAAALFQRTLRYGDCPVVEVNGKKKVQLAFYVTDRRVKVTGAPANDGQ